MSKTRSSNVKKGTNERRDRSLWWFSEGGNGLFIEKVLVGSSTKERNCYLLPK